MTWCECEGSGRMMGRERGREGPCEGQYKG